MLCAYVCDVMCAYGESILMEGILLFDGEMNCLHGKPADHSTTSNGTFWFCGENPSCNFICAENECYIYEKAIMAWRCKSSFIRDVVSIIS